MATMTIRSEASREFTDADLRAMPDDGNRYEILDGSLIVTPAPRISHQGVVGQLYLALHAACPPDLRLLFAPVDVKLSQLTVLQPDLLVAQRTAFTEKNLPAAPLLAVEVLSPSTRHIDLGLKRSAYEAMAAQSYWVVDPAAPSITAWELREGVHVEAGRAVGDQQIELDLPFPVRLTPSALLDD